MKWQTVVSDYFTFTKRERTGIFVLLGLITLTFLLPRFIGKNSAGSLSKLDTSWMSQLKHLEQVDSNGERRKTKDYPEEDVNTYSFEKTVERKPFSKVTFPFDPNSLDDEGWRKLGIRDKTIHTIRNYLQKGGHFYKPGDLKRIYGLRPDDYERLEPYVRIAGAERQEYSRENRVFSQKRTTLSMVDVNTADTSALVALPGIGSKLAARIVSFREKLGGFYSIDQLAEIYGLQDSVFQKIRKYLTLENAPVKKININSATEEEMKSHPYIRYQLAKQIVAYRGEHGAFQSVGDLQNIQAVTESVYTKLSPYLVVEN